MQHRKLMQILERMEPLSAWLLREWMRVASGLMAIAIVLELMLGRAGNFYSVFLCAKGAYAAGVGVAVAALSCCLLGDLWVKEKRARHGG